MVQLSVNVNKVATLRNARGGALPDLLDAVRAVLAAGGRAITIHPREDQRHITKEDVEAIAGLLEPLRDEVELNIEGDPRPDLMDTVLRLQPHQCTLVPVRPGEVTSQAGWPSSTPIDTMRQLLLRLKARNIRVSVFVDPDPAAIRWADALGAHRVELYTEPYAKAAANGIEAAQASFQNYAACARLAHTFGLGINAGHDINLANLQLFSRLPHLDEISIGHALWSRAIFVGLDRVVREYLDILE
ncbi:MAG: pyridoxine 5'-phosphate synthase [Nannocystaceae bacterium]